MKKILLMLSVLAIVSVSRAQDYFVLTNCPSSAAGGWVVFSDDANPGMTVSNNLTGDSVQWFTLPSAFFSDGIDTLSSVTALNNDYFIGSPSIVFDFNSGATTGVAWTPPPVPEPSAVDLFMIGFGLVTGWHGFAYTVRMAKRTTGGSDF